MHGNDAAAHARGQDELEDPIERLLDESAASPSGSPANSALELPKDPLARLSPEPIEVNHTPSSYPPTQLMNPPPPPTESRLSDPP
jgi:hypothetical protein